MSKRRKERKIKERQRLVRLVLAIVGVLVVFTGIVLYRVFLYKEPITHFFPENPIFYARFNLSPSLLQARDFESLSQKFENPDVFSDFVTDFVFGSFDDEQVAISFDDVVGFIGKEVVIGNIAITEAEAVPVMVVDVRNREKAADFLAELKTKLRNRGDAIYEDQFRDETVVSVLGNREIAFSLTDDYLLIAGDESGLKKMIDIRLGSEDNLSSNPDYKRVERTLKGNQQFVFMYYDLVDISTTFLDAFQLLDQEQLLQLSLLSELPSGAVLVPDPEGFKVRILAREQNGSAEREHIDEKITSYVPHDLVSYFEGSNMAAFLEDLLVGDTSGRDESYRQGQLDVITEAIQNDYGVDLENDLFSLFKENYGVSVLRGAENERLNIALISESQFDSDEIDGNLRKLENVFIDFIVKSGIEDVEGRDFVTNEYADVSYRRLNLPEQYPLDINYFVLDNRVVFATTESAVQSIVDAQDGEVLENDRTFNDGFSRIDVSKSSELFYLEPQALFKLIEATTQFEYGALDQELRKLESLSLKTKDEKDAVFLEGFLKIND